MKICLTRFRSYDNINIATETTGNRITIEKYVISLIQSDGDTKDLRSHGNPRRMEGASLSEEPQTRGKSSNKRN